MCNQIPLLVDIDPIWAQDYYVAPHIGGVMETRFRLKVPIRAILDKPDDESLSVKLPAGAILVRHSQPSEKTTTLFGMVGVYWEGRHYSVYPTDLALKAERIEGA